MDISSVLREKRGVVISLEEIKNQVMDEYVVSSVLINLGIRCNVNISIDIFDSAASNLSIWKDFDFNPAQI